MWPTSRIGGVLVSCEWNIRQGGCRTWLACQASARTCVWVGERSIQSYAFCICVSFTMSLSALPIPDHLASMTSIADVHGDAEVTTIVWNAASDSLGNVTIVRVFGLVTLELLRQLLSNLRIRQQAVQGQEV